MSIITVGSVWVTMVLVEIGVGFSISVGFGAAESKYAWRSPQQYEPGAVTLKSWL